MRELKTEASDQLRDDFEPLVDQGFEVEFHVEEGDAGEAICGMAARNNARGIVMGQRDRDNNDDVLIGSVSNYVIHHAPCPVVVVPGRNGEDLNNPMDLDQT